MRHFRLKGGHLHFQDTLTLPHSTHVLCDKIVEKYDYNIDKDTILGIKSRVKKEKEEGKEKGKEEEKGEGRGSRASS